MTTPITVSIVDPHNRLANVDLRPTLQAAVDYIGRYVVFRGTVDIEVRVEITSTGRMAGTGSVSYFGLRNGIHTWEQSMLAESRTGVDPHPNDPDFSVFIDPFSDYFAQVWWDPQITTRTDAKPAPNLTDGFSVIVHEFLHGMGILGWLDGQTGILVGQHQSVWDSLVSVSGGRAHFTGPAVVDLLGEPVEVMLGGTQGGSHLGHGPKVADSNMPWLERSNMNGYHFFLGERYSLGRIELAILQDLGWTLRPGITLTDVVNRWDTKQTPLYMVGWDTNEHLIGDVLADRIEGRGGNDLLVGLDGADRLDGGLGNDNLMGGNDNDTLSGGLGADTLLGGAGADVFVYAVASELFQGGVLVDSIVGGSESDLLRLGSAQAGFVIHNTDAWGRASGLEGLELLATPHEVRLALDATAQAAGIRRIDITQATRASGNRVDASEYGSSSGVEILAAAGAQELIGGAGNDSLSGGGGADTLTGGLGIDLALFAGRRSDYQVNMRLDRTLDVQHRTAGADGLDRLVQMERLRFTDVSVAFDLDANAGLAARMLGVTFGAAALQQPSWAGIALRLVDSGTRPIDLAQLALNERLGPAPSFESVVDTLYANTFGSLPAAPERQFIVGWLQSGAHTPASLAVLAAQTDVLAGQINLVGLSRFGLEYT